MNAWPGTLAPKRRDTPSSGWMRITRALGLRPVAASLGKARWGTALNWRATSVNRLGRRLPVRI